MGYGIGISCNCQGYELMLGVGLSFPSVYQKTMQEIHAGKYGMVMQQLAANIELITVDADIKPYWCPYCGYVGSRTCLDLYMPRDLKGAKKVKTVRWTVADEPANTTVGELGEWPYWVAPKNDYLKEQNKEQGDYALVWKYKHRCSKCRKIMIEFDEENPPKCPKCHEHYRVFILPLEWD